MLHPSLFTPEVLDTCLQRIDRLAPDTERVWGPMSSAQMLAHCADVQEVSNGRDLVGTPFLIRLIGPLIGRMVVNDKPYSRNGRTHPQYVQTEERDFDIEKMRLLAALDSFVDAGLREARHPLFGLMSAEDRDWASYKHLDHHLTQFDV